MKKKNDLDDYDNSHWDGVDKTVLKFTVIFMVSLIIYLLGVYCYFN